MASDSRLQEIGCDIEAIETPVLLIERLALERNIERLQRFGRERSIAVRPHGKGHKSATIGRLQIAAGAVGLCCQKLGEVEAMVAGGIRDITLTNEIVEPSKLRRFCLLARDASLRIAVDNPLAAERLDLAAGGASLRIDVLVDVNIGQNRCGVSPGREALLLGQAIDRLPHLRLVGLQAYQGRLQHVRGWTERWNAATAAAAGLRETIEAFARGGLPTIVVTGAGTGTYEAETDAGLLTEIQAGSYLFMDAQYGAIGGPRGPVFDLYENALFVWTSVMSCPAPDRRIVDAGLKALSCDTGTPELPDILGWKYEFAGDEHGILVRSGDGPPLALGQKLRLVPGHCDTTVNLYDRYHVVDGGRLAAVWPIDARGRLQ
jgi:3-hydroxy-D-aspartate aldolase